MVSYQQAKRCITFIFITCAHVMHSDIEDELGTLSHELTLLAEQTKLTLPLPTKKLWVPEGTFVKGKGGADTPYIFFDSSKLKAGDTAYWLVAHFLKILQSQANFTVAALHPPYMKINLNIVDQEIKSIINLLSLALVKTPEASAGDSAKAKRIDATERLLGVSQLCCMLFYDLTHDPEKIAELFDTLQGQNWEELFRNTMSLENRQQLRKKLIAFLYSFMTEATQYINNDVTSILLTPA